MLLSAGGEQRSCKARDERFASIFDKRNAIDVGKTAQHLKLHSADGDDVDNRQRDQPGSSGP
jgi:hypothetical protein